MKKTISTILTLAVLTAPLSGSTCFANDPKTTTASSQYIPNQSRKKEFQFGKLLNKSKWGKIALGATAGITALAGATIAGLEVLRAKSYSTSNGTCKVAIGPYKALVQELKLDTCDNMFKYAVTHLKSFNDVATSCLGYGEDASTLTKDNDINNLINFANHYHLNLDEAAKAFTVITDEDRNYKSVSFVPYDVMCKSPEFSKRFNITLANAASVINKLGYEQAQEYAETAEKNNLPLSDVIKAFQINEKTQLLQSDSINLSDYLNIAKKYDLPLDFLNSLIKSSTIIDKDGDVFTVPSTDFSDYITLCTNSGLSLSDMTNYAQLLPLNVFSNCSNPEGVVKLANFAKSNNLSFNDIKSFVSDVSRFYRCNLHSDLIKDLNLFSKYAQKYNSSLNDFLNIFRFKDEKGNTLLPKYFSILNAAKSANDYDLPFNSLTNYVKAWTEYGEPIPENFGDYIDVAVRYNISPIDVKKFFELGLDSYINSFLNYDLQFNSLINYVKVWTESGKLIPRNFGNYIGVAMVYNVSPNDLKKFFELGLDSRMNGTELGDFLELADKNKCDRFKLMESLPNIDFYLIETAMDYAQENKLDVFKVIETMSHFDEQDLTSWRFLDSKFKNAKGSADIPNN